MSSARSVNDHTTATHLPDVRRQTGYFETEAGKMFTREFTIIVKNSNGEHTSWGHILTHEAPLVEFSTRYTLSKVTSHLVVWSPVDASRTSPAYWRVFKRRRFLALILGFSSFFKGSKSRVSYLESRWEVSGELHSLSESSVLSKWSHVQFIVTSV